MSSKTLPQRQAKPQRKARKCRPYLGTCVVCRAQFVASADFSIVCPDCLAPSV